MSVYTYKREPSGKRKCTVSHCKRAPACVPAGLLVASCGRFQGLRSLSRWQRFKVRCTEHSDTDMPSLRSSRCMTCPQRRRPTRFLMMAKTIFRESAFGLRLGLDDSVGIFLNPPVGSLAHHFTMALCVYPKCRATFRVDHPFCFTKRTASRRTRGRAGFLVYAMYVIFAEGVIPSY